MKKIVISGYYGFNNLGDEAVLFSMLIALRREIPDLEVTVLSNDPAATAQEYGVRSENRWNMPAATKAIKRSDLLVSGGGSLLQDVTGIKNLIYYLGIIWIARALRRPVMYYAQGIGPINTGRGRVLVGWTTKGVRAVTVRDEESEFDLREMGVRRPVEVTADPVLGLGLEDINLFLGLEILRRNNIQPGQGLLVGVSVRQLPCPATWKKELASALDSIVRAGHTIVFIPMQNPTDIIVSKEISLLMQERNVIINEQLNVASMISLVGNLNLMVGVRLHALIFAAVCGVLPVGVVYDPKVERFLRRVGMEPAGKPEDIRGGDLATMVNKLLAEPKAELDKMNTRVKALREEALRTAQIVKGILIR